MPFITVDWLGGVFSTLSLVFKKEFDVIAGVTYSMVIVRIRVYTVMCWMDLLTA